METRESFKRYFNNFSLCRTESFWIPCTRMGEGGVAEEGNLLLRTRRLSDDKSVESVGTKSFIHLFVEMLSIQCHLHRRIIREYAYSWTGYTGYKRRTENKINYAPKHDTENMTEQRCPAMKCCFFFTPALTLCAPFMR